MLLVKGWREKGREGHKQEGEEKNIYLMIMISNLVLGSRLFFNK